MPLGWVERGAHVALQYKELPARRQLRDTRATAARSTLWVFRGARLSSHVNCAAYLGE